MAARLLSFSVDEAAWTASSRMRTSRPLTSFKPPFGDLGEVDGLLGILQALLETYDVRLEAFANREASCIVRRPRG